MDYTTKYHNVYGSTLMYTQGSDLLLIGSTQSILMTDISIKSF